MLAGQLTAHLSTPFDRFQSELRCKHSTEIALTRVVNYLLIADSHPTSVLYLTLRTTRSPQIFWRPLLFSRGWYLFCLTELSMVCRLVLYWSVLVLTVVSHSDLYLTCFCYVNGLPLGHISNTQDIHSQLRRWHSNLSLSRLSAAFSFGKTETV